MKVILQLFFIVTCLIYSSRLEAKVNILSDKQLYTQQEEEAIFKNVIQYLSTHSLHPYLKQGPTKMFPVGFSDNVTIVRIEQNNNSYQAVFMVNRQQPTKTQMLYMTKGPDQMVSALLFKDIMALVKTTPQFKKIHSPFHIHIEQQGVVDNHIIQKWTFFTPIEKEEIRIQLTPDGQGGMYFAIHTK